MYNPDYEIDYRQLIRNRVRERKEEADSKKWSEISRLCYYFDTMCDRNEYNINQLDGFKLAIDVLMLVHQTDDTLTMMEKIYER